MEWTFLIVAAVCLDLILSIVRTPPNPPGWCARTQTVCPLLVQAENESWNDELPCGERAA